MESECIMTIFTFARSVLRCSALAAGALLVAQPVWANCYEVYGSNQQLLYRSMRAPVDLSRNLHETVPRLAPGARLVFSPNVQGCEIEYNKLDKPAVVEIQGEGFRTLKPRSNPRHAERT